MENLLDSEEQFRLLAENLDSVLWVLDLPEHRIRSIGPAFERLWHLDRREHGHQRAWTERIHPEDRERTADAFEAFLSGGPSFDVEYRIVLPDGAQRWVRDRATITTRDPAGRPLQVTGLAEDVTERKQMEQALRESEQRYRQLADAMPQLVWTAGSDGAVDYYNSRAVEYAGIERAADGTWAWKPVVHPDELEATLAAWRAATAEERPYHCEHRIRMADGSYRWHLSRALPMRGGDGAVRWFGTATDIHDLRAAQEALQEADDRKNEFLATLAHELRNPLNPIRNAVEVLRIKGPSDPDLRWGQDVIDRQVDYLTRLIDDLLDVSRITRNRLELRRERVELAEVIERAVESCRPLLERRGHELRVALPEGPVVLEADRVRLTQVLLNLLNNAIKYTPDGGRITVTAFRDGAEAVVSIRDTGIGIPPDQIPKLFEMFYQVDRSLERSHSGLGIGLTLVKRLVEMHGGTVEARSAGPGQGTELAVRVPAISEPASRSPQEPAVAAGTPGRRILVVDDNRDSAESLSLLLKLSGHEVRTAYDGLEAVEAAERFLPEVVLLDLGMPRLNGYEAARRIRAEPWGKGMLLVAQTGWGQEEDRRRTREAGFDAHLTKPVDHAVLEKLLGELAGGGG